MGRVGGGWLCKRCNTVKPLTAEYFQRDNSLSSGFKSYCKECSSKRNKEKYAADPSVTRGYHDKHKAANYRSELDRQRWASIKYKYGLTEAQYMEMYEAQGGRCAICLETEQITTKSWLSVDHDHATNKVRGLLCHYCNADLDRWLTLESPGEGLFRGDEKLLIRALQYYLAHSEQE